MYTLINHKNVPPTKFIAAYEYDGVNNKDIVRRNDASFIFGYADEYNSIRIKEKSNETSTSFSNVDRGYYKDVQGTGLQFFTRYPKFIAEEIEAYALI